eukprot:1922886-Alexandrium_andersonii.AAC.1
MSASLVGSEMCIRDSNPLIRNPSIRNPANHYRIACNRPDTSTSSRSCAVSYTHLTLPTICSV